MFYKKKSNKDGMTTECKECSKKRELKYSRTKKGLITIIYSNQRKNSKHRKHIAPAYTRNELMDWVLSKEEFHHIFHLWRVSGYDKLLKPSIDRLNDYEPYNFSNIRVITWVENNKKSHTDVRNGTNKKPLKAVVQFSKKMEYIGEYISAAQAGRCIGKRAGDISSNCNGKLKSAYGFIWKFKKDVEGGKI